MSEFSHQLGLGSKCAAALLLGAAAAGGQHSGDANRDGFEDLAVGVPQEDVVAGVSNAAGAVNVILGSTSGLTDLGNQLWHQDVAGVHDVAELGDQFGRGLAWGDYNGDGFDDLAVGVSGEDNFSGAVHVFYGGSNGLGAGGLQFWRQGAGGLLGVAETGDLFGYALAGGDLNGDGFEDLAVGVPGQSVAGARGAGAVHLILGSAAGLQPFGNWIYHQNSPNVPGTAEEDDNFAYSLTMADFNADGFLDVAAGVPGEDVGAQADAGAVNVLYFAPGGRRPAPQLWHQDSAGIEDAAEAGDQFGFSLAFGDFNADTFLDLAVGVPYEGLGVLSDAGVVHVLFGSAAGLAAAGDELWHQDLNGVAGNAESFDYFGYSLASGSFDGTAFQALAIGIPGEDLGAVPDAGAVQVFYGSLSGLTTLGSQVWTQDSAGVLEVAEGGEQFGYAVVSGDFDGDGRDDLAVGVPGEDGAEGVVQVLFGGAGGLGDAGNELWSQASPGINGVAEAGDGFGEVLPH